MEVMNNQSRMWRIFWRKLSYPPMRYQHIQDKNWSHMVIFSHWTHHQPHDISEEGSWTWRWSNYSIKSEVDQLGPNRGVRSVIVNPPVAQSGTEVPQVWWRVQGLVTTPRRPTEDQRPNRQDNPWRCWAQQAAYEESDRNSRIAPSRIST
jgi:hypothetical protein